MSDDFGKSEGRPESPGWGAGKILIILGVVVAMATSCCAVSAYLSFRRAVAGIAQTAKKEVRSVIKRSNLSKEQKSGLHAEVDRLFAAYENGKIGFTEVGELLSEVSDGPLMSMAALWAGRVHVAAHAKLEKEEQATVERAFQRYCRGLIERSINRRKVSSVLKLVGDHKPGTDEWTFRKPLTREEALAFRDAMKQTADEAGVPDAEYEIDFAGELRKMVDRALGEARE